MIQIKNNKALTCILIICTLFAIISCDSDPNTPTTTEESKFFNLAGRGWKSNKINQYINTINYTATEVPLQYYIFKNNQDLQPNQIDSLAATMEKERVVEIEFHHDEEKDLLTSEFTNLPYDKAVEYMSFKIKKDFKVITTSNDTITCAGVLFERNFKTAPFKRAILYFDGIQPKDNIQVIYDDQLFGNGIIKFSFKETPIKL